MFHSKCLDMHLYQNAEQQQHACPLRPDSCYLQQRMRKKEGQIVVVHFKLAEHNVG